MILLDIPLAKGHLSVVMLPELCGKLKVSRSEFDDADEVDYRWLWFAVRVERYKRVFAWRPSKS